MFIQRILVVVGIVLMTASIVLGQKISGKVVELDQNKKAVPLFGANVYWIGSSKGTVTDENGLFELDNSKGESQIVVSYIGYMSDTVDVSNKDRIYVVLHTDVEMEILDIEIERSADYIDYMSARNTQIMSEKELFKAACCNLSESFETNPTVDVSFTDAVTGTKQIKMLGLAGKYSMISTENYPGVRGYSSSYGLTYIPGSWIQSIQLTKGIGSVVNGYESMVGQINVELKKPFEEEDKVLERAFLNGYVNQSGRIEANAVIRQAINKEINVATMLHASNRSFAIDNNGDSFADNPLGNQLNFIHRWKYHKENNIFQIGIKGLIDEKRGGQFDLSENPYVMNLDQKKGEVFVKRGYVFKKKPYKSIGFISSFSATEINSDFGERSYSGVQKSVYANLIYQTIIDNSAHQVKFGASYVLDDYLEKVKVNFDTNFARLESVPGVFGEYTFKPGENFSLVTGLRLDYHNLIGLMYNPRLHLKYHPDEKTTLRGTAGKGQRVSNIFAENIPVFASNRNIQFRNELDNLYGLKAEDAWNYGVSILRDFKVDFHPGSIMIDFYRTDFVSKVVADYDVTAREIWFYSLSKGSYANSLQLEIKYSPVKRLDIKAAYRYYDVKTEFLEGWKQNPLISKHRGFVNLSFETRNDWHFDFTANWNGQKRVPTTLDNPAEYQRSLTSPDFVTMNAQISKTINELHDIYLGVENLTNYRQLNPIVASNDPFGDYFDSSLVWGPVFGRMIYAGARIRINKKSKEK